MNFSTSSALRPCHWEIITIRVLVTSGKASMGVFKKLMTPPIIMVSVINRIKNLFLSEKRITPAINLSTTKNVSISFDYAFATDSYYDSLITDQLNVYTSRDCGETWTLKKVIGGPQVSSNSITVNTLLTAGNSSGAPFLPTADNLWKNISFPLSVNNLDTKTRIKFEFVPSKYANNFYIDNLNINGVLEIEESPITKMNVNVFPNPVNAK